MTVGMLPGCLGVLLLAGPHSSLAQSPLSTSGHQTGSPAASSETAAPVKPLSSENLQGENTVQNKAPQDETVRFLMGDVLVEEGSLQHYLSRQTSR